MGRASVTVRRARPVDEPTATEVLSDAFASDPVMSWLVGPGRDPKACLSNLFSHSLRAELRSDDHVVDIVESGTAVALWHEVDDWQTSTTAAIKMAPAAVRTFGRHLPRALRTLTLLDDAHPVEPHRHLAYIGVHSGHQGEGLGGALLASMVEECDERGVAAYLESSTPRNEALYARYGFVRRDPIALPNDGPAVTPMWREPR